MQPALVLDKCLPIAGLRSDQGVSFELLQSIGAADFTIVVSVPLVLEYEAVAKRQSRELGLTFADIDVVLDYICQVAEHRSIIATALAEKIAALMTSEYLAERALRGRRQKFERVLRKVRARKAPPVPGDER